MLSCHCLCSAVIVYAELPLFMLSCHCLCSAVIVYAELSLFMFSCHCLWSAVIVTYLPGAKLCSVSTEYYVNTCSTGQYIYFVLCLPDLIFKRYIT